MKPPAVVTAHHSSLTIMFIVTRRWLLGSVGTLLVSAAAYSVYAVRSIPRGNSTTGYILGIIGTVFIILLMLLPVRKRQYQRPIGRLDLWMRAHVCLGFLSAVLVGMHAGFIVVGTISIGLTVLFVVTLISGVIGTYLYETTPRKVARLAKETVLHDVLRRQVEGVEQELEALCAEQSRPFRDLLICDLALNNFPLSINPIHLTRWLWGRLHGRVKRGTPGGLDTLPPAEWLAYQSAAALVTRRVELGRQLFYQRMLRQWLWTHIPASAALFTLLIVHIIVELYY